MAKVKVKIYKWGGEFWPFKIKTTCGECGLSVNIIRDVAKEFEGMVEIEEVPWLDNWHRVIFKGGWHAPIIMINNKVISQGVVVDRDILRGVLVKEIHKDFRINDGVNIFTLPNCNYCKRVKEIFKKKNIKFQEYNVLESNINMQKMLSLVLGKVHPIKVPQIFINGRWIKGGASRIEELEKSGELDKILES